MNSRKTRFWSVTILILVCILTVPAELPAQCAVSMSVTGSQITSIMFTRITKTLSMGANCPASMLVNNAFGCGEIPGPSPFATKLVATNFGSVSPSCSWGCTCVTGGTAVTITITTADGLPVELMDFSIEAES